MTLQKEKGILSISGYNAGQITGLLANHHFKDVFICECKNGETWGARDLLRLDAWVLKRTYSPLTTIGYEIKVSRADFEQDQKWVNYLPLCHYFYFVCPAGLIRSVDLPQGIGLVWVSSSGKLHYKNKAERKTPDYEKQNGLLIYALMARSKIVADMYQTKSVEKPRLEMLREYVQQAEERKTLAYFVKSHIKARQEKLDEKERELSYRESDIKRFTEQLTKLGITWDAENRQWRDTYRVENEIRALKNQLSEEFLRNMEVVGNALLKTGNEIKALRIKESDDLGKV
jgi:hypothetical protein